MMKGQKGILHGSCMKVAVFLLVVIAGLAIRFDFYYDLNDDTAIKDIISGAYTGTPSGYSIQMLYPLSALIALCYRAIPGVSWYGLFLCLCQFGVLALVAKRITKLITSEKYQILALISEAVVAVGLLFRQFVMVQYSVASGICMAGAIFLFVTSESPRLKDNICPILLVVLAFSIRTELCLMLLPFLLLAGFARWMSDLKNTKSYMVIIISALAGMVLVYSMDLASINIGENAGKWKTFRQLFDDRTSLYDFYGLPEYETNRELYKSIGLSEESYTLLTNYNYSLDENIDVETLNLIAEYQKQLALDGKSSLKVLSLPFGIQLVTRNSIKEALWLYKNSIKNGNLYIYIIIISYILYFLIATQRRQSGAWWRLLMLLSFRSIIWVYLFMVDRMLDRIIIPLYFAEMVLLISWIITEVQKNNNFKLYYKVGIFTLISFCGLTAFVKNYSITACEYEQREVVNPRWESLIDYCINHSDNYYLVDVYSSTSYNGTAYSEKLFKNVDNSYRNFDICGGWVAKSPLTYEKLLKSDITHVENALTSKNDNVYFVISPDRADTDNLQWLKDYYVSKGKNIEIDMVDTVSGQHEVCFYIYKLEEK